MAADETNADDSIEQDDVIQPDSVSAGRGNDDGNFEFDDIAENAVDVLLGLLRRANALAGGVLFLAFVACVGGYLLGIAALGGGLRTFWIIAGGLLAVWAIGSVIASMFRLRAVRRGSDTLVDEVRSLISGDSNSERTVIETVESTEGSDDDGIVNLSRQFFSLRDVVKDHPSNFPQLSMALASITTLPGAMALATVIGFGFAGLSVIFALVLIF
jgi:hypothetical protein